MPQVTNKTFLFVIMLVTAASLSSTTQAGKLDITLAGFVDCRGSVCTPLMREYETFMAEYVFGIAPKKLAPAETLGYSGFYMGVEGSLSPRPLGEHAEERWLRGTASDEIQAVTFNPGIHIRKGLPFSFEIGFTVNYLVLSELVSLGGEVKWSLFEGFRKGWRAFFPDLALRGSIVRVIGQTDVDITLAALDASISYAFGIVGMITMTPYVGYQYVWSVIHTEPILYRDSADNYHHQIGTQDYAINTLGNPILGRSNMFFGLRLGYEILAFTVELDWGLPNTWNVAGADKEAKVEHQIQISSGLGVDF